MTRALGLLPGVGTATATCHILPLIAPGVDQAAVGPAPEVEHLNGINLRVWIIEKPRGRCATRAACVFVTGQILLIRRLADGPEKAVAKAHANGPISAITIARLLGLVGPSPIDRWAGDGARYGREKRCWLPGCKKAAARHRAKRAGRILHRRFPWPPRCRLRGRPRLRPRCRPGAPLLAPLAPERLAVDGKKAILHPLQQNHARPIGITGRALLARPMAAAVLSRDWTRSRDQPCARGVVALIVALITHLLSGDEKAHGKSQQQYDQRDLREPFSEPAPPLRWLPSPEEP